MSRRSLFTIAVIADTLIPELEAKNTQLCYQSRKGVSTAASLQAHHFTVPGYARSSITAAPAGSTGAAGVKTTAETPAPPDDQSHDKKREPEQGYPSAQRII